MKPIAVDLWCGLGGWAEGLLAEGFDVIGFDIEWKPYPGWFVMQDVRTLHGSQFKDAALIVGSSPCQEFSYRAMPWKRAKALPPPVLGIELFQAQFRIQREACAAAGRYIPMVVENVCGAQKWVGPARGHYGSYYLWGDVDCVGDKIVCGHQYIKAPRRFAKVPGLNWSGSDKPGYVARAFNTTAEHRLFSGRKLPGNNSQRLWRERRIQRSADGWVPEDDFYMASSGSSRRKAASAQIAKIPFALARHIARCYKPDAQ